ncbi:MAG: alginate O-acetyltransferase AlgX-related protein [Actinophytocola sp.]|uniref:alginate O-acetyltransferase AlgX-related protein n=1 Tax=Actinophytocola sp. TaxID=1872138 RepID=UPI003D6AA778
MSASTDDLRRAEASEAASGLLPPVHESELPTEHSLYRPRHGTRQRTALISAAVFFLTPLLLLVIGVRPPAIENRELAEFPTPAAGWGLFTGLNPWATDHLPLRPEALAVADAVSRGLFGEPPPLGQGQPAEGPAPGPVAPPDPTDEDRERIREAGFPRVIEGSEDWLYLGYDMLGACLPERPLDEVIDALDRLRNEVERSGRKFVLIVAPDKSTMVPDYLPKSYVGQRCASEARNAFWRRVIDDAGARDIRPALEQAAQRRGLPIYSKVDTHWTFEGGLAMTRLLAEEIEPGVTDSWRATPADVVRREGDLPPLIGRKVEFPMQTYDLAPDGSSVTSRAVDSGFREPLRLNQSPGTGVVEPSVGVVADSFTLLATPYLAGTFTDLTAIHSDTVGVDPASIGPLFADKDVVVFQAAERSLLGGINPLLDRETIDTIGDELSRRPR